MNPDRRPYVVALVVALVLLVGSMGLAAGYLVSHRAGQAREALGPDRFGPGPGRGMMGDAEASSGGSAVSLAQARGSAQDWVAKNAPGATVDDGVAMPMGYMFTVTQDDRVVARIMVNDDTGQIVVRTWAVATPSASGSA